MTTSIIFIIFIIFETMTLKNYQKNAEQTEFKII